MKSTDHATTFILIAGSCARGYLTMSVAKRIADMGEFDAKAALLYMVNKCEETLHCDVCPAGCKDPSRESCMDRILDEAIKEGES